LAFSDLLCHVGSPVALTQGFVTVLSSPFPLPIYFLFLCCHGSGFSGGKRCKHAKKCRMLGNPQASFYLIPIWRICPFQLSCPNPDNRNLDVAVPPRPWPPTSSLQSGFGFLIPSWFSAYTESPCLSFRVFFLILVGIKGSEYTRRLSIANSYILRQ
jgi:hypothetical protein